MPRHQARLQHGRTSACFACDEELLKLNSGCAPRRARTETGRFLQGLSMRFHHCGGMTNACHAIKHGCLTTA
jgi:hypothetical protein